MFMKSPYEPLVIERAEGRMALYPRRPPHSRRRRGRGRRQHRPGPRGNRARRRRGQSAASTTSCRYGTRRIASGCAERLARWTPPGLNHFFFASGGSEAVEAAIKFALMYHKVKGRPQQEENHLAHGSPITAIRSARCRSAAISRAAPITSRCCSIGRTFRPRIAIAARGARPIPDAGSNAPPRSKMRSAATARIRSPPLSPSR